MRTAIAAFLYLSAGLAVPACAAWDVASHVDPMTDRKQAVASLPANGAPGVRLVMDCKGPEVQFAAPVALVELGVNFRFDSAAPVARFAGMSSDGRTAYLWATSGPETLRRVANGKRLRIQIFPVAHPPLFFEFDLTGGREALDKLGCR